jgi:hypothetical protein
MMIFKLNDGGGFFCMFFFLINHYIYCEKYKINFKIDSENWQFLYKNGWLDYFSKELFSYNNYSENIQKYEMPNIIKNFRLVDYKIAINNFYINNYNDFLKNKIEEIKIKYSLIDKEYGSIFIRRGDKLYYESTFYDTQNYIKLLLEKYTNCKIIFLQTDDYNTYIDLNNYINQYQLNITVITLCKKLMKGFVTHSKLKNSKCSINENINYINIINNDLNNINSLDQMTKEEIFDHTVNMLVGIDIVINSKICITDYQSNVSRFIKLAHNNFDNVFTIEESNDDLNLDKMIKCPCFSFEYI